MKEKVFRMIDDSAQELQAYAADVARNRNSVQGIQNICQNWRPSSTNWNPLSERDGHHRRQRGTERGQARSHHRHLGELDADRCPEHPKADPDTGAAHACGHHMQQSPCWQRPTDWPKPGS